MGCCFRSGPRAPACLPGKIRFGLEERYGLANRLGHVARLLWRKGYSAATLTAAGSTFAAQNLNSGILPNGSSCGLVRTLAAASA